MIYDDFKKTVCPKTLPLVKEYFVKDKNTFRSDWTDD